MRTKMMVALCCLLVCSLFLAPPIAVACSPNPYEAPGGQGTDVP